VAVALLQRRSSRRQRLVPMSVPLPRIFPFPSPERAAALERGEHNSMYGVKKGCCLASKEA
jgi:hypothetical protein